MQFTTDYAQLSNKGIVVYSTQGSSVVDHVINDIHAYWPKLQYCAIVQHIRAVCAYNIPPPLVQTSINVS